MICSGPLFLIVTMTPLYVWFAWWGCIGVRRARKLKRKIVNRGTENDWAEENNSLLREFEGELKRGLMEKD